ncbi:MAG: hypothetical protein R3F11_14805 [Verrucomicrobiales bacterium]
MRDRIAADAFDKVLFLDCDCLALRNIDHLLEGDWDIRFHPSGACGSDAAIRLLPDG